MRPPQERQLNESMNERPRGCKSAATRRCVCRRLSAAEGPIATLPASWDVDLGVSVPLGMGPGPKHVGTLTLRSTSRGHAALSLGPYVTAVTAISNCRNRASEPDPGRFGPAAIFGRTASPMPYAPPKAARANFRRTTPNLDGVCV